MRSVEDEDFLPKSENELLREEAKHLAREEQKISDLFAQMSSPTAGKHISFYGTTPRWVWGQDSFSQVIVDHSNISGEGGDGELRYIEECPDNMDSWTDKVSFPTSRMLRISGHIDPLTRDTYTTLAPLHPENAHFVGSFYFFSENGDYAKICMVPTWLFDPSGRTNLSTSTNQHLHVNAYESPIGRSELEIVGQALKVIKARLTTYLSSPDIQ